MMQQELRTPIEKISFRGIHFRGSLVLTDGIEGFAQSFIEIGELVMQLRRIMLGQQRPRTLLRALQLLNIRRVCRGLSQRSRLFRQRISRAHHRIGAMPAEAGSVSHS